MDRARIVTDDVVDRYVGRRLSAEEEAEFEAYLVAHPELADEIDLTNRMKLGLRTLQERGELETLRRGAGRSRVPAFAIAASILVVVVAGAFIGLRRASLEQPVIAPSLAVFSGGNGSPAVTTSYTLMRSRTQEADLVLERPSEPSIVQLRILPETSAPRGPFRIVLSRVAAAAEPGEAIATTDGVPLDAQGFLTIFIDTGRIEPGFYRLALTDTAMPQDAAGAAHFLVEVR